MGRVAGLSEPKGGCATSAFPNHHHDRPAACRNRQQSTLESLFDFMAPLAAVRQEFGRELAAVRHEFGRELANLRVELIRWSFLVWIGQVAAMAGLLALMLRIA